jgi:integrase
MRKPNRKPKERQKSTDVTNLLSEQSRVGYTQACKQFCRWATKTKRLSENPVADLHKKKVTVKPHRRDRFQTDELAKLVSHTLTTKRIIESLDGKDRALLYLLAAITGLRKAELGSLSPISFDLDANQVRCESAYTKNGNLALLPLHDSVLPLLRQKLAGMERGDLLWPGLATKDGAHMIQHDMRDCGLPVRTERGIRAFHSLRNTYISMLFDVGVDAATAQKLARHGDVNLTLSYCRLRPDAERQAVAKLVIPGLPTVAGGRVKRGIQGKAKG